MATKDEEAPVDTRDALEVLESEAKEWDKVRNTLSLSLRPSFALLLTSSLRMPKSTAS